MGNVKDIDGAACGVAALSMIESLLLALGDAKILGEEEIVGVVSDAADAHRSMGGSAHNVTLHREVVAILDRIIASGNSVRRS